MMKWVTRIAQGLMMVGFLMSGAMKLSGNADQAKAFTDDYGYSIGFMYLVGALEVLGAIGLLVGFWKPKAAYYASSGLVLLMAGAVFTVLKAGQGTGFAMVPLVFLILAVIVMIGRRSKARTSTGDASSNYVRS